MLYPVLEALIFLAFFLCAFFCVVLSGSKNQFDVVSPIDGCLFSIAGAFEEWSFHFFIWNDTEISCDDMTIRWISEWWWGTVTWWWAFDKIININIPYSGIKVQILCSNSVGIFVWYNWWRSSLKILWYFLTCSFHVSLSYQLSCEILLKLMSSIPLFTNLSFRKLRISLQFTSLLTGLSNLNLEISKVIDMTLGFRET